MLKFEKTQTLNKARRSFKTSFVIVGSELTDEFGHTSVAVLEVTTHHYGDRKQFSSTTVRTRTHNDGMFTVGSYDLFEVSPIARLSAPSARYSAKALEAAHTAYLEVVTPQLEVALEWAAAKEI